MKKVCGIALFCIIAAMPLLAQEVNDDVKTLVYKRLDSILLHEKYYSGKYFI
jgi:hypothetical protein